MSLLQKKPKLKDALNLLRRKSDMWDEIGIELLDLSYDDREQIKCGTTYYSHNYCLEKVLDKWLQQEGDPPTWDQLLQSLAMLGGNLQQSIRDIQKFLNTDIAIERYTCSKYN